MAKILMPRPCIFHTVLYGIQMFFSSDILLFSKTAHYTKCHSIIMGCLPHVRIYKTGFACCKPRSTGCDRMWPWERQKAEIECHLLGIRCWHADALRCHERQWQCLESQFSAPRKTKTSEPIEPELGLITGVLKIKVTLSTTLKFFSWILIHVSRERRAFVNLVFIYQSTRVDTKISLLAFHRK